LKLKAEEHKVPPYRIFQDEVLLRLVQVIPTTLQQFKAVEGISSQTSSIFGPFFLPYLISYSSKVPPTNKRTKNRSSSSSSSSSVTETEKSTLVLFKEGKSISEIAAERNLVLDTILGSFFTSMTTECITGHLANLISKGVAIDWNGCNVSEETYESVKRVFEDLLRTNADPSPSLIKQQLPDVSYGQIHLCIARFCKEPQTTQPLNIPSVHPIISESSQQIAESQVMIDNIQSRINDISRLQTQLVEVISTPVQRNQPTRVSQNSLPSQPTFPSSQNTFPTSQPVVQKPKRDLSSELLGLRPSKVQKTSSSSVALRTPTFTLPFSLPSSSSPSSILAQVPTQSEKQESKALNTCCYSQEDDDDYWLMASEVVSELEKRHMSDTK
jgi:hypothetical protein